MGIILAAALLFTPKSKIHLRIFAGYVLIPATISLVLSHSRSGLIGAFAGICVICLGKALRRGWKRVLFSLVILCSAGAGGIFALLKFYPPMRARMVTDISNNIRIAQVWPDTWSMIKGEGFWGAAPGVYINVFEKYRERFSSPRMHLEYAHNEFLNTLAEYGWLVSAVMLVLLGWMALRWLLASVKSKSDQAAMIPVTLLALYAGTFSHAVFDFNLHIPANGLLFVAFTGWLTGQGTYRRVWKFSRPVSSRWIRIYSGFGVAACAVMMLFVTRMMLGGHYEYRMIKAEEKSNFDLKYEYAEKMRAWMPWAAKGWTELGNERREKAFWLQTKAEKQEMIDASRLAYQKALSKNPYDAGAQEGLVELARIENRPEQALIEVLKLRKLTPFEQHVRIRHGLILRDLNRPREALAVFEEAQKMYGLPSKQLNLNIRRLRELLKAEEEKDGKSR